jgi:hypothetical protein
MIARLLDTAASLLVYFLAATLVAVLIIGAYLWSAWQLDGEKLSRMLAVAQGVEPPPVAAKGPPAADEAPPEEVSHEAIVDKRAQMFRDLELRELELNNALGQLEFQERQLAEHQAQEQRWARQFETQLQTLKQGAEAAGREVVRSTLETLKPAQAKEQVFEMLDAGEMDEVVLLLAEMPASNRGKILAEFKTPEENERLAEILREIRKGAPEAPLADQAMSQINEARSILR